VPGVAHRWAALHGRRHALPWLWSTISMAPGRVAWTLPLANAGGVPSPLLHLHWGLARVEKSQAGHASVERYTGHSVMASWCPIVLLRRQATWEAGEAPEHIPWCPLPHEGRSRGTTRHH
jgi:hypothetical protein